MAGSDRIGVTDPAALKDLRLQQRRAETATVKAHQPEDFGAWLDRRNESEEATLERLEALFTQRSTKQRAAAIDPNSLVVSVKRQPRTRQEQDVEDSVKASLRRAAGIEESKAPAKTKGRRR